MNGNNGLEVNIVSSLVTTYSIVLTVTWLIGIVWLGKAHEDTPVYHYNERRIIFAKLLVWTLLMGIFVLASWWASVLMGAWE